MSDPRDVGLPPTDRWPSFSATPEMLSEVRRRRGVRRQRRIGAAGTAMALVAGGLFLALNPGGVGDTLQQDQPAGPGTTFVTSPAATPTPSASQPPLAVPPGGRPVGPGPTVAPGLTPAPAATAPPAAGPHPGSAGVPAESTQVRRDVTAQGQDVCRQPLDGWSATGWCFVSVLPSQWRSAQPVTLSLSLCRSGTDAAQVRFPHFQQAAWSVNAGRQRYWNSNWQGTPFIAGETLTVQPGRCLRWRVDWNVTTHGGPMPAGDYSMTFVTGAELRNPSGRGYNDAVNITIRA